MSINKEKIKQEIADILARIINTYNRTGNYPSKEYHEELEDLIWNHKEIDGHPK
jgi:NTP pyrophosphatase (non-canonical NTP hydrolase)